MKFYLSEAIGEERLPFTAAKSLVYGKQHYSWHIIAQMYANSLEMLDFEVVKIVSPDIYQSPVCYDMLNIGDDDIHICVKPDKFIRPMFGIRNFFVCGWEFPEFSTSNIDSDPTRNQISTLKRAEQVICWSDFTTQNLIRNGVTSAKALPPPVCALLTQEEANVENMRCLHHSPDEEHGVGDSTLGRVRKEFSTVFLSVLNPWDKRKNLKSLITAFTRFSKKSKNDCALVLKLIVDNTATTAINFPEIMKQNYGVDELSPNIFFFGEFVDQADITAMYKLFDFYLCASSAEGLNLPLIESMAVGMVPISSQATAMADYIRPNNAVVLPARAKRAGAEISAFGDSVRLTHYPPTAKSLMEALEEASALSGQSRAKKAKSARQMVHERYGLNRFSDDIAKAISGEAGQ